MGNFKMPTQINFGLSSLSCLQQEDIQNALIVCDPYMVTSQKIDLLTCIFDEMNVRYAVFSETIPDPTIDVVTNGVSKAIDTVPDTIVALGGGSAIDTAKAIRQMYQSIQHVGKVSLIAIPTTSGTGSEVTSFAVISDPDTQSKYALVDDNMIPNLAILDPELTLSVPSTITADTGMDVMTHAIEAYVSNKASDFTDACGEKALKLAWKYLVHVVKHPQDLEGREKLHNASCLAGMAFSEASLGICHSLAHALGAQFHVPHGRANAILLPHVISYNAGLDANCESVALKRYEELANMLNIKSGTRKATVHAFIINIQRQMNQINMPRNIDDLKINENDFIRDIPEMTEKAMNDICTATNPRKSSTKDLEKIYLCLCSKKTIK